MATFGQIPSNIDFSKMHIVADIAARDALTGLVHGDRCMVTGLGQFGVQFFFDGSGWKPLGGQLLEKVTLDAAGSIPLTNIVSGFSKLVVLWSARSSRTSSTTDSLLCFIDGDSTVANYHRQANVTDDGSASVSEVASPAVGFVPAADSPTDSFGIGEAHFVNYGEASRIKQAFSNFTFLRGTDRIVTGTVGMAHDAGSTGTIDTSLVLDGENADCVSGSWAELWGY